MRCHVSTNFFSLHLLNEWENQQEEAFSIKGLSHIAICPFVFVFQTKPILGPGSITYIMMDLQYRFHQQVCDEQSLIDFFKAAKIQC